MSGNLFIPPIAFVILKKISFFCAQVTIKKTAVKDYFFQSFFFVYLMAAVIITIEQFLIIIYPKNEQSTYKKTD